jgi:hypothetical protein
MQALHMITIVDTVTGGCIDSYARHSKSTIRKFDGKYMGLMVGDHVVMHHTDDPQTKGAARLTELLQVSALSIGTLEELTENSVRADDILDFYPLAEGEERNPDELFIEIYF